MRAPRCIERVLITYQTRSEARFWRKKKRGGGEKKMEKKKVPRSIQKLVASRVQVSFHTYTRRYTRTHQAPHIFSFDTVRPAISSNGSCPAMGALSSARRLNDVARGPTTSELGTFIENESPPYMQPPKNTVSHTMHPWKTIRALSSPSLSPPLFLSLSGKNIRSPVVPIIKIPETYRTIKQKPALNILRTAKQTAYKLKFFRWSDPMKNGYRMGRK